MGIEKPRERDTEEPEFFVYLDYSGNIKEEMGAKKKIVNSLLKQYKIKGIEFEDPIEVEDLIKVNTTFGKFAEFPMTLDFLIETTGGGLTWVGTYGPTAAWEKGLREGEKIMKAAGFPPIAVTRPMKGGHYGVLRFIMIFNKKMPEDRKIVSEVNSKLCDMALDLGFIPYKAPAWAVKKFIERIDPNYLRVMREIKKLLDPNGIMNPGRWLLDSI
ncbi:MAG: FAD-linked oxidase C-terminal domain-containing protein [Candidatus Kryptoniota bacterium]